VERTNGKANGHANGASKGATSDILAEEGIAPAPPAIRDLAAACVRFVQRAVGVELDYTPETMSLLDHYVEQGRKAARERPETVPLVAQTVGAYLGEVLRRSHHAWWRIEDPDPLAWRLELESVFLVVRPMAMIARALLRPEAAAAPPEPARDEDEDEDEDEATADVERPEDADARAAQAPEPAAPDPTDDLGPAVLELDEDDRQAVAERLALLPEVSDEEYHAPSTHLEVVDIVVETLRARRMAAGLEADAHLEPDDYGD
jgi:hypothetical protein